MPFPSRINKVALVTASSAGLGAAIAKGLAAANMSVMLNYSSNEERALGVKKELESMRATTVDDDKPQFGIVRADLGDRDAIQRLVSETVKKMGRLDVVVSNGGWTRIRDFGDLDQNLDEDDWDRCFAINVKSHLRLLEAARPHLDTTQGSFITVASVAGVKPSGSSIPYAVTKAAQIHMVQCLAKAVGPNIRVNSVSPGILMTDWGRQFPEERLASSKEATILKRFATVEDVSSAVNMLVSNASFTGQNLIIDSGFSIEK